MEIKAKIARNGSQIRLFRPDRSTMLISFSDARRAYTEGRVTKSNELFNRLAENDFDAQATIAWFAERPKRLPK